MRKEVKIDIVTPKEELLADYAQAVQNGWYPDDRGINNDQLHLNKILEEIKNNPKSFINKITEANASDKKYLTPRKEVHPRLPSFHKWIYREKIFCGRVSLRWEPGTSALPDKVPGHVGYSVVPWMRGFGIATEALRMIMTYAEMLQLEYVELVISKENAASIRVAEKLEAKPGDYRSLQGRDETFRKYRIFTKAKGKLLD